MNDGWVEEGYEGNPDCEHEWKRANNIVIDTLPPIVHVVCNKCGRVEHRELAYPSLQQ